MCKKWDTPETLQNNHSGGRSNKGNHENKSGTDDDQCFFLNIHNRIMRNGN